MRTIFWLAWAPGLWPLMVAWFNSSEARNCSDRTMAWVHVHAFYTLVQVLIMLGLVLGKLPS